MARIVAEAKTLVWEMFGDVSVCFEAILANFHATEEGSSALLTQCIVGVGC